jgi:hypothetical protein
VDVKEMESNNFGAGGMPANERNESNAREGNESNGGPANDMTTPESETSVETKGRQPDFRVVQPEFDTRENKTVFKDVGALWHNVSSKTGRGFYTLKIGKMRLLVFPNQKLKTKEEAEAGQ